TTVAGLVAAAMLVGTVGCGGPAAGGPQQGDSSGGTTKGEIMVFAGAAMTESVTQIGKDFEAANPGTRGKFSFAGDPTLDSQINQGAPVDVYASANMRTMKAVTDAGNAGGNPVIFARNQPVIVVPKGNPKGIRGLADLARAGVKVALCAAEVPCGD